MEIRCNISAVEDSRQMLDIIASIVVYENPLQQIQQAIGSVLHTGLNVRLYIVDNSSHDAARILCRDPRIVYIFNRRNIGFGPAHNLALRASLNQATYHLVMNPDVYFDAGVLEKLLDFASQRPDVGLVMPKILSPDGSLQYLCKRLPSPADLILRRFVPDAFKPLVQDRLARYELRDHDYSRILSAPTLSGCFMLISDAALNQVGCFDERYFLYLEDVDLSRRIHQKFTTLYFPHAAVYHRNGKGSYRKFRLLKYHIVSAFRYFQKWGWFSDPERAYINENIPSSAVAQRREFNSAAQD
jgi:GT2 family glycosyltransferase